MMKSIYTLIRPSFDMPQGKTRDLVDKLLELREKKKNEGADELLAIVDLLTHGEDLHNINYLPVEGGAVSRLSQEFIAFLCSFKSDSNPLINRIGNKYGWKNVELAACTVQSATAAITASLIANGVTSGEVITTSLNFLGVPNAIILAGATPNFVDIGPYDLCMDPNSLEKMISRKTRAIVLVHFNQVVDLMPIEDILEKKGIDIPVIQDASLAIGSTDRSMPAGAVNLGKSGTTVYSFATSKSLSGLGGAAVVANDRSLIERIQSITYQGMQFLNPDELLSFGGNFKMNDLNATIILEQLKKSETIFEKRRMLKSWYDRELEYLAKAGKIVIQKVSEESVVTHYAILIPDRKAVAHKLLQKGIEIGFWHTTHLQKIYQKRFGTKAGSLPVSESLAPCITFLPFHTKLEEKDVSFICNEIKKLI